MDRPLRIVIGESPETCGMAAYHVDLVVFATYPESDSGRPKMHLVSPFAVATEVGVSRLGGVGVAFGPEGKELAEAFASIPDPVKILAYVGEAGLAVKAAEKAGAVVEQIGGDRVVCVEGFCGDCEIEVVAGVGAGGPKKSVILKKSPKKGKSEKSSKSSKVSKTETASDKPASE